MNPSGSAGCDLPAHFAGWNLDAEARAYIDFHAPRFRRLLGVIEDSVPAVGAIPGRMPGPVRILDIGPGLMTQFLRDCRQEWVVDSLGFADHRFPCRPCDRHIEFDLNDSPRRERRPTIPPHDLVLMTEVLEHLPTSPFEVVGFVAGLVAPGGRLVVQTPNACALPKRLRMLRGFNPYEMIRDVLRPTGHIREYTRAELLDIGAQAGLTPVFELHDNYFQRRTAASTLFRRLTPVIPRTWRDGMTVVFAKGAAHGA